MQLALPPLYPIVNVRSEEAAELSRIRRLAMDLATAGVELIQLRAKTLGAGAFTELAAELVVSLRERGCALIVNDRVDVALAAGAAGVHLGDEDLPVKAARRLIGPDAVVGYSTHSLADVGGAPRDASYLGFGPVFESPTKAGVREPRGTDVLRAACAASSLPVVAIGGITLAHAPAVWAAGAASCAVISEIERTKDVAALVRAWHRAARRLPR
jgi:thiamine-phosphate pyrophosphorylase